MHDLLVAVAFMAMLISPCLLAMATNLNEADSD
jgi:hypothetical protein